MQILKLGLARASDIGGDVCEQCQHDAPHRSCVILVGEDDELRNAAKLLYRPCELSTSGTNKLIDVLNKENEQLREALNELLDLESPHSLFQVMETLSDAAELLLHQYGYDGQEHELIQRVIDHGKGIREKIAIVQKKLME
jgi:hypothetical protein